MKVQQTIEKLKDELATISSEQRLRPLLRELFKNLRAFYRLAPVSFSRENIDVLRSMRAILQQLELFVGLLEDYHMLIRELITLTRGSGFWRSKETPLLPGGVESV